MISEDEAIANNVRRLGLERWAISLFPYGSKWRNWQKVFYSHLQPTVVHRYHPIEMKATRQLLYNLLDTPQDFLKHIRQCVFYPLGPGHVPEWFPLAWSARLVCR